MKKIAAAVISVCICVSFCGCGNKEYDRSLPKDIGGKYFTDSAYGMDDFKSEIDLETDDMEFDYEVEHFGEEVEEDEGRFTFKNNVLTLRGEKGAKVFEYDPEAKTLYNAEMDTTWTHSSKYIEAIKENKKSASENAAENNVLYGKYVYSDDAVDAELVIEESGFSLTGKSKANGEVFETAGKVTELEGSLVLTDNDGPVVCAYDEATGTINYDSLIFTKAKK